MPDVSQLFLGLLAILTLVLANGFFVAAEFALVTVRRTRIDQLIAEGSATTATVAVAGPASVSAVTPRPPHRIRVTGVRSFTSTPFA